MGGFVSDVGKEFGNIGKSIGNVFSGNVNKNDPSATINQGQMLANYQSLLGRAPAQTPGLMDAKVLASHNAELLTQQTKQGRSSFFLPSTGGQSKLGGP